MTRPTPPGPPAALELQPAGADVLQWPGKRLPTDLEVPACRLVESHGGGDDRWQHRLFWGDNLGGLAQMIDAYRGQVQLIYIDPPFDSRARYKKKIQLRGLKGADSRLTFEETQYTDVWGDGEYLQFMYERLLLMRELLAETGTIWVHCDWHRSHHLRCLLDEVFGPENFINEIVWRYRSGGRPRRFFARKHDTLFWYARSDAWTFNGEAVGEERGPQRRNHMKRGVDDDGRVFYSIRSNGKVYKYYEDDRIVPDDVWDISHLQQRDPERTSYPTQKPEALVERVVLAASNPGDLVLDAFLGSGTTAAVAARTGRRFLGIDANSGAIATTTRRILDLDASFQVLHVDAPPRTAPAPDAAIGLSRTEAELVIEAFAPPRLLERLAEQGRGVDDWRHLADAVMIDWRYDGQVLRPTTCDLPVKGLVAGRYPLPPDAGTIAVQITDIMGDTHRRTLP